MRFPRLPASLALFAVPPLACAWAAWMLDDEPSRDVGPDAATLSAEEIADEATSLCAQLGDRDRETRAVAACRAWRSPAARDPRVQYALLRATVDFDAAVRSCAANAFRAVGDVLCVDEVLASAWRSGRPQLRAAALAAVPASHNRIEAIGPWVRRAFKDSNRDVVCAAFDRLPMAGMSDEECAERVMEALRHGDDVVKVAALNAAQRAGRSAAAAAPAIAAIARADGALGGVAVAALCAVQPRSDACDVLPESEDDVASVDESAQSLLARIAAR